jgi:signal transduction histidine kinase
MLMKSNSKTPITHASFKRQLLTILIVSVISLTTLTSFLTAWQTSQTLRKTTINNSLQITSNFAEQSVLALLTGSKENGQEAIDRALGFTSVVGVAVYKLNGEVLIKSEKMAMQRASFQVEQLPKHTQLLYETDNNWTFSAMVTYTEDSYDESMVNFDDEVTKQLTLGYVLVQYNKEALRQIQQTMFLNNISTGVLVAFTLALLIRLAIIHLTKPLLALSQTMATARDSGTYSKATVDGALEIRQMAEIYNQLMATLQQQNTDLEKSRNTLESEVEIRTQELVVARDGALTASRHKSEFLANISHELRTPLQAIIGYNDLVREDLELECMDAQVEDLNKSTRSAHNLLALINNILDLSKIEAGQMDLYIKSVNIKNLVNEAIDTVLPMARTNDNVLKVNIGSLSSTLYLDRQKLMQVFLNLLSNACKFTKSGIITFNIHNDKNFLYYSISDTGVGIEKNKLDYIFEEFTQVDGSQTRKFEGTGLGMAITQNFCQLMGGTISVKSELGIGSVFSVKQPLKTKI